MPLHGRDRRLFQHTDPKHLIWTKTCLEPIVSTGTVNDPRKLYFKAQFSTEKT